MAPSHITQSRCRICGAAIYPGVMDTHIRNQHPELFSWGRQRRKWMWLVLGSGTTLIVLDALYLRPLNQILQYVIPLYLGAALYLWIIQLVRKERELRDAWRETHPYQVSPVTSEVQSDLSTTQEGVPVTPWRRRAWIRAIFWIVLAALCGYLLFLLALGGYPAPP